MMKSCMVCTFPLAELSNPDYKPNWTVILASDSDEAVIKYIKMRESQKDKEVQYER